MDEKKKERGKRENHKDHKWLAWRIMELPWKAVYIICC
jgi:hypothetical protein